MPSVVCPNCRKSLNVPVERLGTVGVCPGCKQRITIPSETAPAPAAPPKSAGKQPSPARPAASSPAAVSPAGGAAVEQQAVAAAQAALIRRKIMGYSALVAALVNLAGWYYFSLGRPNIRSTVTLVLSTYEALLAGERRRAFLRSVNRPDEDEASQSSGSKVILTIVFGALLLMGLLQAFQLAAATLKFSSRLAGPVFVIGLLVILAAAFRGAARNVGAQRTALIGYLIVGVPVALWAGLGIVVMWLR